MKIPVFCPTCGDVALRRNCCQHWRYCWWVQQGRKTLRALRFKAKAVRHHQTMLSRGMDYWSLLLTTCALVPNQWQLSTAMLILLLHFSTTCRSCVPNQVRSLCIIESVASPALRCWTWVEPCSCVRKLGNYTSKKNIFYKACITWITKNRWVSG